MAILPRNGDTGVRALDTISHLARTWPIRCERSFVHRSPQSTLVDRLQCLYSRTCSCSSAVRSALHAHDDKDRGLVICATPGYPLDQERYPAFGITLV